MKINIVNLYSKVLSFLLVLLGFASCESIDPKDEYGSPYAKFKVIGVVVDKESEDKAPIKNIRVIVGNSYHIDERIVVERLDSVRTDNNGYFNISLQSFPTSQKFTILLTDVDGVENGAFEAKTDSVEFKNPIFKGGEGWYEGEATEDVGVVEMTPVKPKG